MCLYPTLIKNKRYLPNKKNGGLVPRCDDDRKLLVPIGCGKCIECAKKKQREWQVRLLEDIKEHKNGAKVAQGWKGLNIQDKNLKLQEFKTEIDAQYPNVWNVTGRAIDDMITQIVTLGGKLGERHKTKTIK